jgi:hypothetical protein
VIGLLVVPRTVRFIIGMRRYETLVIACLGLCFALALAAQQQGYSTALGAFLAGSLIAESGRGHLVSNLRHIAGNHQSAVVQLWMGCCAINAIACGCISGGTCCLICSAMISRAWMAAGSS